MKSTQVLAILLIFVAARPINAQQASSPSQAEAPLLTLEDAVSLAVKSNRLLKNSALESEKFDYRVSTARSRRLPIFQFNVLGGEMLHSFDFTFPAGSFGTFASTGPIPSTEAKIHTPAQFTTYITGAFDQPLTQLYKIGLGIRATELGRDIAREDVRATRQKLVAEVRSAYFDFLATQTGVDAARQAVVSLEEAQRVTVRYRAEQTVLKADALEIDARLAKSHYDLSLAEDGLATQREHLNQLLGRDLNTSFRAEPIFQDDEQGLTLQKARERASESRPEIRQAHLKEKQAEYERRAAKAEYIPDLSLSVRYQGINNVNVLPQNVTTAGFFLSWEPFDWGRRRNNVAEKAKTVQQARNGANETEAQIAVEVGAKYRKWQEAALLLKASRIGHEAAVEQLRVTTSRYGERAALIRDLLQAQAKNTESAFQYQQALSSYWSALADLRRAMGDEK